MRIAICEDDVVFMSILTGKLHRLFKSRQIEASISCFDNPHELVAEVMSHPDSYDIYFLDIEMPGKRGTALSKELRQLDPTCRIIFITAYDSEVYNAFHYRADGFVPKSMLDARLPSEIDLIMKSQRLSQIEGPAFFCVDMPNDTRQTGKDLLIRLRVPEIVYFESVNRKILLHACKAVYTLKNTTYKEICAQYLRRGFIHVHRCYLVNLAHIKAVGGKEVFLSNDEQIILSRRFRDRVIADFMKSIKERK